MTTFLVDNARVFQSVLAAESLFECGRRATSTQRVHNNAAVVMAMFLIGCDAEIEVAGDGGAGLVQGLAAKVS